MLIHEIFNNLNQLASLLVLWTTSRCPNFMILPYLVRDARYSKNGMTCELAMTHSESSWSVCWMHVFNVRSICSQ